MSKTARALAQAFQDFHRSWVKVAHAHAPGCMCRRAARALGLRGKVRAKFLELCLPEEDKED